MGERQTTFATGVAVATGQTAALTLGLAVTQNASLSGLPTTPPGAAASRAVRVRGTVVNTATATASLAVQLHQLTAAGTQVGPTETSAVVVAPAVGLVQPFEFIDTAPPSPATYVITVASGTASTCTVIAEIEDVN